MNKAYLNLMHNLNFECGTSLWPTLRRLDSMYYFRLKRLLRNVK
jgi:hypothetical protein